MIEKTFEEGDVVLCTVENVTNTVTHVKLESGQTGTIISSEIAPGRIKNMRQYVTPNKKIVCKVLQISGDNIYLSLRRVTAKEKKEVMEKYKQEQAFKVAFRQIIPDKFEEIIQKILKDFPALQEFINHAKEKEEILKKYIPKDKFEAIKKITEKKRKTLQLKYNIKLTCLEEDGLPRIKKIFDLKDNNIQINYTSAGNYMLKLTVDDFKEGKKKMNEIIEELSKRAKKTQCEFFASEEK